MNISEKLKGIMTDDEIAKFEQSVQTLISEQVESRLATEIDSIKKKYDAVAEEYCKKMISEGIEAEKTNLIAEYDKKILVIEDKVMKGFDLFLEQEILPQISDETISKIAINEAFAPIVNGIKKVLEENYIAIDTEGSSLLGEAKEEIVKLNDQLSESIAEKMQLNERLEKVATHLLISESTNGLNEEQKQRVSDMFKDKPFDEVEDKIKGFVEFICESEVKKGTGQPEAAAPVAADQNAPAPASATGVILEGAIGEPAPAPAAAPTPEDIYSDAHVTERADRFMY